MSSDKIIVLVAAVLLFSFSVSAEEFDIEQSMGDMVPWNYEDSEFDSTSVLDSQLSQDYEYNEIWTESTSVSSIDISTIDGDEESIMVAEHGQSTVYVIDTDDGSVVSTEGYPDETLSIYDIVGTTNSFGYFAAHEESSSDESSGSKIDSTTNTLLSYSEHSYDTEEQVIARGHEDNIVYHANGDTILKWEWDSSDETWGEWSDGGTSDHIAANDNWSGLKATSDGNHLFALADNNKLYRLNANDLSEKECEIELDFNVGSQSTSQMALDDNEDFLLITRNKIDVNSCEKVVEDAGWRVMEQLDTGHFFEGDFGFSAIRGENSEKRISEIPSDKRMDFIQSKSNSNIVFGRDQDDSNVVRALEMSFPSSATWSSTEWDYDDPYEWEEIELGGVERQGNSEIEVTVETSNDGFDTVEESDTLFDSEIVEGTETYPLFLDEEAEDIRFEIEFSDGGSEDVAFVDYLEFRGDSAFDPPVLKGKEWNVSNPEFGDTVSLLAEVEDPDGEGIDDTRFSGEKDGQSVFSDVSGEQINSTHWKSDPVEIDCVECSVEVTVDEATDIQGNNEVFDEALSLTIDNTPPEIETGTAVVNQQDGIEQLLFDLEYFDKPSINSWTGTGQESTFNNQTLELDVGFPVNSTYQVSDWHGDSSSQFDVDFDHTEQGLEERTGFDHDLTNQRVQKEVDLTNNAGRSIEYYYTFDSEGSNPVQEHFTGQLSSSSSMTETGVWEDDWITNVEETTYELSEHSGILYDHSLDEQAVENRTQLHVDNTQSFTFNDVDLSNQCSMESSSDVPSGTGIQLTDDCNRESFTDDWIENVEESTYELSEDENYDHSLSEQRLVNRTELHVDNTLPVMLPAVELDSVCSEDTVSDIESGDDIQVTDDCNQDLFTDDWIHSVEQFEVSYDVNHSADHTVGEQYLFNQTGLNAVNERTFRFSDVDISSECNVTETADIESGSDTVTSECVNETIAVDWVDQLSFDLTPDTDEVVLEENYTALNDIELENTGDFNLTGVGVDDSVDALDNCVPSDDSTVDIDSGETVSEDFEFDCTPGVVGTPFIDREQVDGLRERVWYNTTDLQVYSNVTKDRDITWRIDEDDLPDDWKARESGSREAFFNGKQENVSSRVTADGFVELTCEVGCGNSSLSEGTHSASLMYTTFEDDDSGSPVGGSGPSDPDQGVEFSSTDFGVPSGRVAFNEFEISNLMEEDNKVTVSLTDAQDCHYFEVRESLENTTYGDTGEYVVPDASAGLEPASTSVFPGIRVEMPEPEERDFRDTVSCPVEVDAEHGTSPDLVFRATEDETFTTEFLVFVEQTVGVDLARERSYTYCLDVGLMLSGVDDVERECAPEDLRELSATNGQILAVLLVFVGVIAGLRRMEIF